MSWLPNPDAPRHGWDAVHRPNWPANSPRPAHPDDVQDPRYRDVWPSPNHVEPEVTS